MPNLSNKPRLGFIGAGFIGQLAHLDNYAQLAGCELYALAEIRADLRESVGRKYNISRLYSDHLVLLADPAVDAVIVVTARAHTVEVVRACLLAGKHVFSEKPMANNSVDARMLCELAAQQGLIYCVGYMKRLDAGVQKAKALFDGFTRSAELGQLLQISAKCYMGDSYCKADGHLRSNEARPAMEDERTFAPAWLAEPDKANFVRYLNVHSHLLNLIRYFVGETPEIEYFNYRNRLAHIAVLRAGDVLINLETAEIQQREWQESCTFLFEFGQLIIELPPALLRNVPAKITVDQTGQTGEKTVHLCDWSWAFRRQAEYFIGLLSCTVTGNILAGTEALTDIELAEAIWQQLHR